MTETEIIALARSLDGVAVLTASEEGGAPEVAWGDTFFYYTPAGTEPNFQQQPFATLVVSDYPGFDVESRLDRPGVFRLNLAVGRDRYGALLGHPAAEHEQHRSEYDYAESDVVLPHPVYAAQGWVSIVNPGPRTAGQVPELFGYALDRAAARDRRRSGTASGNSD